MIAVILILRSIPIHLRNLFYSFSNRNNDNNKKRRKNRSYQKKSEKKLERKEERIALKRLSTKSPLTSDAIARRDAFPSSKATFRDTVVRGTRCSSQEGTSWILIVVGTESPRVALSPLHSARIMPANVYLPSPAQLKDNDSKSMDVHEKNKVSVEVKRFSGRFQGHEAERRPWSSGDARFAFNPRLSRRERNCYIRSSYVGRQSRSFTIPVFSLGHEAGALFTGRVIVGHVGVRGSTVRKLSWARRPRG